MPGASVPFGISHPRRGPGAEAAEPASLVVFGAAPPDGVCVSVGSVWEGGGPVGLLLAGWEGDWSWVDAGGVGVFVVFA